MASQNSSVSLVGVMGLIKKSKHFLAPIFEAITNSFESIAERQYSEGETPFIQLDFFYRKSGLYAEMAELVEITVTDNGVGFTEGAFFRYRTLLDKSKGFNNRGSGRLQYLHRFDSVEIESAFYDDGKIFKRTFSSSIDDLAANEKTVEADDTTVITVLHLKSFNGDKNERDFFNALTLEQIKFAIRKKFLLKFYLEKEHPDLDVPTIRINFHLPNKPVESTEIGVKDVPEPHSTGELTVPYLKPELSNGDLHWIPSGEKEDLKWAFFKLPDDQLDQNAVYLCSKNVAIQEVGFLKIRKNEIFNKNRYVTLVYGDVLNSAENVSDSVDRFLFPTQKNVEREFREDLFPPTAEKYLFIDSIENSVKQSLPTVYQEIAELKTEQLVKANSVAAKHGIPESIVAQVTFEISDTEEKIAEKLYKKQAEQLAKENVKIERLYETLKELNPTEAGYQKSLEEKGKELLELIPLQNKQELSRYVIRREMVTTVLKLILANELDYQKTDKPREDREGLVHDLVFKRKSSENDGLNDLWILNEEYLHFEGCSDLPINQIVTADGEQILEGVDEEVLARFGVNRTIRRPDIFLFAEEGKCVLVEFKAHDVDLSNHLNQLTKYCNLIANCSTTKFEQFYCYLIGENVERVDLPGDFRPSVSGDYIKPNQPIWSVEQGRENFEIAQIYQEVIKLSAIHRRAYVRNKSFADKLGLRLPVEAPASPTFMQGEPSEVERVKTN